MTKHYILNLDPTAHYDWDRQTLRDPITANHPALADLVAAAVGHEPGSYLVAVNIEVNVLEKVTPAPGCQVPVNLVEVSSRPPLPQLAEVA